MTDSYYPKHGRSSLYDLELDKARAIDAPANGADAEDAALAKVAKLEEKIERLRKQKNAAYSERNQVVALLARIAPWMGWNSGIAYHPEQDKAWERDWRTIAFIDLPSGQASWHFHDSERHLLGSLPRYLKAWDGHTTEEKYWRVRGALQTPCIMADHECRECGRIEQPCRVCRAEENK